MNVKKSTSILIAVANATGVSWSEIIGKGRKTATVDARRIAYYFLYHSGLTVKEVGYCVGDRDHSTVSHGLSVHAAYYGNDDQYKATTDKVGAILNQQAAGQ